MVSHGIETSMGKYVVSCPIQIKNLELTLFKVQSVTAVKFKNRGQTELCAAVDRLKNLVQN